MSLHFRAFLSSLAIIAGCSSEKAPARAPGVAPPTKHQASKIRSTVQSIPGFAEAFPTGLPPFCHLGTQSLTTFLMSSSREQCRCFVKKPNIEPGLVSTKISCGDALEKFAPRSLLNVEFGPKEATIHHGGTVTFHLYLSNPQEQAIPIILTDIPGRHVGIAAWPEMPHGDCNYGSNDDWLEYVATLQPGARLTYEYTWDATHSRWNDSETSVCVHEVRPLPVGKYKLFWHSPAILDQGPVGWPVELTVIP